MVVVLTFAEFEAPLVADVEDAEEESFETELEDLTVDVVEFVPLAESLACWRPAPCAAIRAGPNVASFLRNCGVRSLRTSCLTGCFCDASEYMSMSN